MRLLAPDLVMEELSRKLLIKRSLIFINLLIYRLFDKISEPSHLRAMAVEVHEANASRERSSHERRHVSIVVQSFLVSSKMSARFHGKEFPSGGLINV